MQVPKTAAVTEACPNRPPKTMEKESKGEDVTFLSLLASILTTMPDKGRDGEGLEKKIEDEDLSDGSALCTIGIGAPLGEDPVIMKPEEAKDASVKNGVSESVENPDSVSIIPGWTPEDAEAMQEKEFPELLDIAEGATVRPRDEKKKPPGIPIEDEKMPFKTLKTVSVGNIPSNEEDSTVQKTTKDHKPLGYADDLIKGKDILEVNGKKNAIQPGDDGTPQVSKIKYIGKNHGTSREDALIEPMLKAGQTHHSQEFQRDKDVPDITVTDVVDQVIKKMKVISTQGKTEIDIQLKPESLGRLKVNLTVTEGVLNGRIMVQNDETRDIIQANILKLHENLEQQGVSVGKFHVDVGGGYNHQQFFDENRQTRYGRRNFDPYEEEEKVEYILWKDEGTIELLA